MVYMICIAVALAVAIRLDASLPEAVLSGAAVWLLWRVLLLEGAVRELRQRISAQGVTSAQHETMLPSQRATPSGPSAMPPDQAATRPDRDVPSPLPPGATAVADATPRPTLPIDSATASDTATWTAASPHPLPQPTTASAGRPPASGIVPATMTRLWEAARQWLLGGNPAVRLGVVILFFGVAFLLKFAAERAVLPIELRLAGVAIGAIALLGLGWRLRQRGSYGLVLQGGGIGALYLTIFAALRLYEVLPAGGAFALLVGLTVTTALLAILQDARALAALGIAAGFLAPVLTSTGSGSHVALFSYYALLNAGIVGISGFRAWRVLNLLGFVFTFVIGSAWGAGNYRADLFWSVEPFLLLFFLFYLAISVLFARRQPAQSSAAHGLLSEWRRQGYVDGTLVFGLPIVVFSLQTVLVRPFEHGLALSALGLGALYIGLARTLRTKAGLQLLTEAFLALGIVFTSLAIPLALDGRWTAAAWGLEGAALVWIGVRQQRITARLFGLMLQLGATVALLAHGVADPALPFINGVFVSGILQALAGLFAAWYLQRHRKLLSRWEQRLRWLPLLWGAAWWYGSGFGEIERALGQRHLIAGALLWCAASAVAATLLRPRLRFPQLQWLVQALLPATIAALLATLGGNPLVNLGWLGFPVAFAAIYWTLRQEERYDLIGWHDPWHAVTLWTLAAWGSAALAGAISYLSPASAWQALAWAGVPGVLVLCLARLPARLAQYWPLATHMDLYRRPATAGLVAALGAWLLLLNLGSAGDPSPLPYLPLLNPLDLGSLLALLAMALWSLTQAAWLRRHSITRVHTALALGALGFLWLNALLARTVHHWLDVPLTRPALMASTELQAAVALLWSTLALVAMTLARRDGWRRSWFIGVALMGAVLIKLFLVDLAGSGTVARIVAFLGVGGLLLVIGYLTPLPPAARSQPPPQPQPQPQPQESTAQP